MIFDFLDSCVPATKSAAPYQRLSAPELADLRELAQRMQEIAQSCRSSKFAPRGCVASTAPLLQYHCRTVVCLIFVCAVGGILYDAMLNICSECHFQSLVIVDVGAGGVSLLVDAEQTYLQPAIDACVQALQREHNTVNSVVVFNTIQARFDAVSVTALRTVLPLV